MIDEVCAEEGIRPPRVRWMKRKHLFSSGKAWSWNLQVVAGTNRKEVREVLLHELTHVVMGQTAAYDAHHGEVFYAKFFAIAKRHGIGAQFIKQREKWYKPRGLKAGYRLYLKQMRGEA